MNEKTASQMSMAKHAMMTCINMASLHVTDAVGLIKKTKYYKHEVKRIVNQMNEQALKADHITVRLLRASDDPGVFYDAMDAAQNVIEPRLKTMITETRAQYMKDGVKRDDVIAQLFIAGLLASMSLEGLKLLRQSLHGSRFAQETEADLAVLNPEGLCSAVARVGDALLKVMKSPMPTALMDIPKVKEGSLELCDLIMSKRFVQEITKYAERESELRRAEEAV